MKQNLPLCIVDLLARQELHVRAIAKKLQTNHMAASRTLRSLMDQNVVDAKTEGRNKVYFLKQTEEARNMLIMAELHKLNNCIKAYPQLRRIVAGIQQNKAIKLAVLFGSYAKGTATKASDIDLFIETRNPRFKQEGEALDARISVKIGTLAKNHPLANEIKKNHVIIKGAEHYYEKLSR